MEKLNIAELLRDCPTGMELDCTLFEDVHFDCIDDVCDVIKCYIPDSIHKIGVSFDRYGCYSSLSKAKCVIFPKGKTTWEGFQRPFKDGDVLATDLGSVFYLNTHLNTDERYGCYVGIGGDGSFHICEPFAYKECCGFATEKEKEKLFKAIKDNGYRWNSETKTLNELIKPKFKVGDKVRVKNRVSEIRIIDGVFDTFYSLQMFGKIDFTDQDNLELVPNKFDITTLKPFDKVLVRNTNGQVWTADLFSHVLGPIPRAPITFVCVSRCPNQCIPYESNEYLLGTSINCDDYYKTW